MTTTVKYASDLARAEAELRAAERAHQEATVRLSVTRGQAMSTEAARRQWTDKYPNLAELKGRPTYRSPVDGMALSEAGEEVWATTGGPRRHRVNGFDIGQAPPPSEELIERLTADAAKAERKVTKARAKALKARAEHEPAEATGHVVVKAGRIAGMVYAVGDPFDVGTLDWRKADLLIRAGHIRAVGH